MKLENYRHYLMGEYENRKGRNPGYSLRAFARDLNTSPSRLSEAINGKRGISSKLAEQFIEALNLEGIDAEVFRLSVESEHARSGRQKLEAQEKLKQTLDSANETPLKTFTVVDWIAEVLLKMNEREPVTDNTEKVSSKLGVPEFMVVESLRFLTRLGFIKGAKGFKTYLQNRGKGRKLNVDYIQILEQAQKAYVRNTSTDYFQHEVILLEKKDMERAERILQKAFNEIRKLENKSKNSKIMIIANQVFSAEKEGR